MSHERAGREGVLPGRAIRRLSRLLSASLPVAALVIASAASPAFANSPDTALVPSAILCSGYATCAGLGYQSYNYASRGGQSYWSMTAGDECTNYVAYVESTAFGAPAPGYLLGNAGQWPASAAAHGVTVNRLPSVGAVAEWDGGAYGIGAEGHVAVVEAVGPDDKYILISQQHISSDVDGFDWTRINAGFPADSWQSWPSHFIHFAIKGYASVGYYSARTGSVAIRDSLTAGPASVKFRLSRPGMIPLAGNWTGRGTAGGYYNPANGTFHLRTGLDSGRYRPVFTFGPPGMIPLAGDWTGDGADRIGYYDPQDGSFHLHYYLSADGPSRSFTFGPPGMIPLAGDWAGKRADSVGYYNPRTGRFTLRAFASSGPAAVSFAFGPPGMIPLAGNWTGGRRSEIGYYNPRTGWYYLRAGLNRGRLRYRFRFGPRGMLPLAADWLS